VRGWGGSCAEAFEQAALALTAVVTDPAGVATLMPVVLHCDAPDPELLLVDWLNAVIFEMASRHLLFGRYAVKLSGNHLEGTAWGEPIDARRHQPAVEPKGATYTALSVRQEPDGRWRAQCVVDV
jgi:SHS2 domain-containing protein